MPAAFDQPVVVLLRAQGREPGESGLDAPDRRTVSQIPLLRQPADGVPVAAGRRMDRPSSGPAADAADGPGGDLPGAQDQQSAPSAQDLSLSASPSYSPNLADFGAGTTF